MSLDMQARAEGMGATHTLPYKTALICICFLALAIWNAFEVFISTFRRFHRYTGLYFYSLIAASAGIPLHALGYFFRFYDISKSVPLQTVLVCGGGMLMITGQSIVLWSRLHLISPGRKDRWLLCMIVCACIIVQGGATVLFTASTIEKSSPVFLDVYQIWEPFQCSWFAFQECLISGIYIYRTSKLMRSSAVFRGKATKRLFNHLMIVNAIIIAFDVTIVTFQFVNLFYYQTSWKTFAYAVKLRLEFDILQKLVDFTRSGFSDASGPDDMSFGVAERRDEERRKPQAASPPSRFGNSSYARMSEEAGRGVVSLADIVRKTTKVEVTIEKGVSSGMSTKNSRVHEENISRS
ncbi:hypothetical protein NX059_002379 [Plenodomus lindquistii]|nr:hypothetical protein NX059_002379 [Plenodomus lindquistii]